MKKKLDRKDIEQKWHQDKYLLLILLVSSILAIENLGDRHFWGDEIHLINLGKSIEKYGLPIVDQELKNIENTYDTDDISGTGYGDSGVEYYYSLNGKELYTLHPWIASYIMATSLSIFGNFNEFFIRLPFVIVGLLSIVITYLLAKKITKDKFIALLSALLLGTSVVFLLAIRCANYYSIVIFAVPLIILSYIECLEKTKHAWWKLGLSASILFHAQWLIFIGIMSSIALHFIIYNLNFGSIKKMIKPAILTFVLTFPWFYLTQQYDKVNKIASLDKYIILFGIGIYHYITWFVPIIFLLGIAFLIIRKYLFGQKIKHIKNLKNIYSIFIKDSWKYSLLIIPVITSLAIISMNYYSGTPIRYFYGLLPLAMIINACVIGIIYKKIKIVAIIILILMIFSNVIHILPVIPLKNIAINTSQSESVLDTESQNQKQFFEKSMQIRMPIFEYIYEITHTVKSPNKEILDTISKYEQNKSSNKIKNIFIGFGDSNTPGYYLGLKPSTRENNFYTREYEWIVLSKEDPKNEKINLTKYERIEINSNTEKWGDTADPVHHLFKTTSGNGFYLYRKIN